MQGLPKNMTKAGQQHNQKLPKMTCTTFFHIQNVDKLLGMQS